VRQKRRLAALIDAWDRAIPLLARLVMDTHTEFVVTPWRDSDELLALRHELYGADALRREKAVHKVSEGCLAVQSGTDDLRCRSSHGGYASLMGYLCCSTLLRISSM